MTGQSEMEPLRGVTITCDAAVTRQVTVVREGQNKCCDQSCDQCMTKFVFYFTVFIILGYIILLLYKYDNL